MDINEIEKKDGTQPSDEGKDLEPSQKPRTEREKAIYNLKKVAERVKELGENPEDVLGIKPTIKVDDELSDDTPLTVGTLRKFQKEESKKTALQMAEEIEDEDEREKVKYFLKEKLVSSTNPQEDLNLALSMAGIKRTAQIAQDLIRKTTPNRTAAGGSSPAKIEEEFVPTEEESVYMKPPYNLKKEKILELRKKQAKE